MLSFLPPVGFRYSLKQGMTGSDVWALQMNLNSFGNNIAEDGSFGPQTTTVVKSFQAHRNMTIDGIAGPQTQMMMCLNLLDKFKAQYPELPAGLLRGIIEGESGYSVGCVNTAVPGGIDVGWTQDRIEVAEYSDERFHQGFKAATAFPALANLLDSVAKSFYGQPGAKTPKDAWWCATLNWNWPAAAQHYADGTIDTWTYQARYQNDDGTWTMHSYKMSDPAQWIERIGVKGISTGYQWADFYVQSKWIYVTSWPTP